MNNHIQCSKCVMDTTDPEISFDENGICNHCRNYNILHKKSVMEGEKGETALKDIINKIKAPGSIKIYYSLEISDKPHYKTPYNFDELRRLEIQYHGKCDYTMIQNENRASCISEYNHVAFDKMKWIYLPVSVKGGINKEKSKFLNDRLKIDEHKKIILNFGMVAYRRQSVEIAEILNNITYQFQAVFHGAGGKRNNKTDKQVKTQMIYTGKINSLKWLRM